MLAQRSAVAIVVVATEWAARRTSHGVRARSRHCELNLGGAVTLRRWVRGVVVDLGAGAERARVLHRALAPVAVAIAAGGPESVQLVESLSVGSALVAVALHRNGHVRSGRLLSRESLASTHEGAVERVYGSCDALIVVGTGATTVRTCVAV